ncbi:hypothetical protein SAMD00019534_052330, partial [Acytostelium subglobosum LB1]|uniref:hypothetical protein n=1 Tax=Acytostelium subglobosum LB1 TaxID=1410327 RepID=UPI000644DB8D
DDEECIICKSSRYINPNTKLLTAPCGHIYCETCIDAAYKKDQVIMCKECASPLRRQAFVNQRFDDGANDKENQTRKTVLKTFNKRQDNFTDLFEYNNYLELVEDIIFQLLQGGEEAATAQQRIKEYQRTNQQSISENRAKKEREDSLIAASIAEEQRIREEKRNFYRMQDQQEMAARQAETLKTMNDLADGKISAKDVKEIDRKKREEERQKEMLTFAEASNDDDRMATVASSSNAQSSGFNYQVSGKPGSMPQAGNAPPGGGNDQQNRQPPPFAEPTPLEGFKMDEMALKNHIPNQTQSAAGGFKQRYIKQRATEDAFGS